MKRKGVLKRSSIMAIVLSVLLLLVPSVSADTSNSWVAKASMNTARSYFQSVEVDGIIYAIGGINTASVEAYDPTTNTWTTKASMSITKRSKFQAEVVDGIIYVMGGVQTNPVSSVEAYNPTTDTWTTKASMPTVLALFQSEVIDGKIYIIGGTNGSSYNNTVYVYDPATNTWTTKATTSDLGMYNQTEVIDGIIYTCGGVNATSALSSLKTYDPATNTWTVKASMSTARYALLTEVIDGKIYAIGGSSGNGALSSGEVYDPTTDTWTNIVSSSVAYSLSQSIVYNGKIYTFGGANNNGAFEVYDPTMDTWTTLSSMLTPRSSFEGVLLNGTIYAIGGATLPSMEAYIISELKDSTLTATASTDSVIEGNQFTTTVAIHNVSDICAEDITVTYDPTLIEYVSAAAQTGLKIYSEDTSTAGTIRYIIASQGIANAATDDKDLITLTFKAIGAGTATVDITKGRIADNTTLEEDVDEDNCGETSVTILAANKDVNNSGEVTLLDLGIDAGYYGDNAADTDTTVYDADVNNDGVIDDTDLELIKEALLANSNYAPNN